MEFGVFSEKKHWSRKQAKFAIFSLVSFSLFGSPFVESVSHLKVRHPPPEVVATTPTIQFELKNGGH